MTRLFTAILGRNEAGSDRYLRRVLERCREFSDAVLFLDDKSTDNTAQIARDLGCIVRTRNARMPEAWGNESPARRELWEFGCEYATKPDDWLLICDADQIFHGNPRELCLSKELNTWCVVLFDLWSETEYRDDGHWKAHENPRPWLFAPNRVPEGFVPAWNSREIHTGHCPINFPMIYGIAQPDLYNWRHLAYITSDLRRKKLAQYLKKSDLLSPQELAHARSITDLEEAPRP